MQNPTRPGDQRQIDSFGSSSKSKRWSVAMSNPQNQHDQAVVFNLADKPVIADAIFPELPESRTVQGLSTWRKTHQKRDCYPQVPINALIFQVNISTLDFVVGRYYKQPLGSSDANQAPSTGIQCWPAANANHFGIIPIVPSQVSTN
jgi:hypothetical protein